MWRVHAYSAVVRRDYHRSIARDEHVWQPLDHGWIMGSVLTYVLICISAYASIDIISWLLLSSAPIQIPNPFQTHRLIIKSFTCHEHIMVFRSLCRSGDLCYERSRGSTGTKHTICCFEVEIVGCIVDLDEIKCVKHVSALRNQTKRLVWWTIWLSLMPSVDVRSGKTVTT